MRNDAIYVDGVINPKHICLRQRSDSSCPARPSIRPAGIDQLRSRTSSACTWRVAEKCMGNAANASPCRGVNGEESDGGRERVYAAHKRQQRGEGARAASKRAEGKERARKREREKGREPLFVTVSGLSRSIISRKVLLTALIFRLFLPLPCCSFSPFVLSLAPFFCF